MKSNAYVSIDAHIIRCRLHHVNTLSYSVALKSGKNQQVSTGYKAASDLIIDMDSHLSLQADKHAYEQFPKLTLIVNVMGEKGESKTVGTTFANFKKEGVQTFQISECSCKDKAFEVDICFSIKVLEPKSSNTKFNKNQTQRLPKRTFQSEQVTPRQSREFKGEMLSKHFKQASKKESPKKEKKLQQIKSQKILSGVGQSNFTSKQKDKGVEGLKMEIAALNQRIISYEEQIVDLKRYKKMLYQEQINSEKWHELLKLEEEKNGLAMSHIVSLEELILGLLPKFKTINNVASITSFKIIEQEDEILMMNEELQSQLEKERGHVKVLTQQIQKLQANIEYLALKIKEAEEMQTIKKVESVVSAQKAKSHIGSLIESPDEILIASRCSEKKDLGEKEKVLKAEIEKLQMRYEQLKIQIYQLEQTKKTLSKDFTKTKGEVKKIGGNIPLKSQKADGNAKTVQKGSSKQKSPKIPPVRGVRKSATSSSSNFPLEAKKSLDVHKSQVTTAKNTKFSSETQTKTEGGESVSKSQLAVNEMKSEHQKQIVNEALYFVQSFQQQLNDF